MALRAHQAHGPGAGLDRGVLGSGRPNAGQGVPRAHPGSRPGDLFVHRNIAAVVAFNDNNFTAVLHYALVHLGIRCVVVCGHTDCGGLAALQAGSPDHVIQDWLNNAEGALAALGDDQVDDPGSALLDLHIRIQVGRLERFALVERLRAEGEEFDLVGLAYDLASGGLRVVCSA